MHSRQLHTQHNTAYSVLLLLRLLLLLLMRRVLALPPRLTFVLLASFPPGVPTYPTQNPSQRSFARSLVSSNTMASTTLARAVGKLQPVGTMFLLCDIQERFRDVIWHFPQVRRGRT
jgi:hypothetical protein